MEVDVRPSKTIDGVVFVSPVVNSDARGSLTETYRRSWLPDAKEMVQANHARRAAGCVVGLHYHLRQADYWYVTGGHARVVLHDLRHDSPTEGATLHLDIGDVTDGELIHLGVYVPPGVAHGFAAITPVALTYLVDAYHDPDDELGIAWDDPEVAAEWLVDAPLLSDRDAANPPRSAVAPVRVARPAVDGAASPAR